MSHAVIAYAFVVGLVATYVLTVFLRERGVDREIADLEAPDECVGATGPWRAR